MQLPRVTPQKYENSQIRHPGNLTLAQFMYGVPLKKVKCTFVQTPRLCTDRTAHRGSRSIALTLS